MHRKKLKSSHANNSGCFSQSEWNKTVLIVICLFLFHINWGNIFQDLLCAKIVINTCRSMNEKSYNHWGLCWGLCLNSWSSVGIAIWKNMETIENGNRASVELLWRCIALPHFLIFLCYQGVYVNEICFLFLLLQFSCFWPCFPHLRDWVLLEMHVKINFLPQLHLLMMFYHSNRKETNVIDKHILTNSYCWKPYNQYNEEICLVSIFEPKVTMWMINLKGKKKELCMPTLYWQ